MPGGRASRWPSSGSARAADLAKGRLLGIKGRGAVLTMDRCAYDNDGTAVEYGRHCYRPDLYSVELTLVEK